jgi:hypothetical protein
MAGLGPAIHAFGRVERKVVDPRTKPGDDGALSSAVIPDGRRPIRDRVQNGESERQGVVRDEHPSRLAFGSHLRMRSAFGT